MTKSEEEQVHASRAGSHARILDWTEAVLWIALIAVGILVALAVLRESEMRNQPRGPVAPAPTGLIEAEDLARIGQSRDFPFWLQPTSDFLEGKWSGDAHMFASNTTEGDWIEFRLPEQEPGHYALELFMTKAADYGIVAVAVNGIPLLAFDLWAGRGVLPTGALKLGDVELGGSDDVLRLEVSGKNPDASPPFFQFGIDGIRLAEPAPPAPPASAEGAPAGAPDAGPPPPESDAERASADAR